MYDRKLPIGAGKMYAKRLSKLTKRQCVQFAIYCAEQVIEVFEKEYPNDSRPRKAIEAAKHWLVDGRIDALTNRASVASAYAAAVSAYAAAAAAAAGYAFGYAGYAGYAAIDAGADRTAIENYLKELEACTTND